MTRLANRYERLIQHVFEAHKSTGTRDVEFGREDLVGAAETLGIALPKKRHARNSICPAR